MAPRSTSPDRQRARILDAAYHFVLREGCENLSMRGVAADLGQSAASFYRHFEDKEHLATSLAEHVVSELLGHLQQAGSAGDAHLRLLAAGRLYIDWGLAQPELFRLTFMVGSRPGKKGLSDTRLLQRFAGLLHEDRAPTPLMPEHSYAAATYLAGLHGAIVLLLSGQIAQGGERESFIASALDCARIAARTPHQERPQPER